MNKTVTVNISGIVFNIEVDAYDKLNVYLSAIKNYLSSTESREEIMADIEMRIAELFKERMGALREVIIIADIDYVVETMGEPEQYFEGTEDEPKSDWQSNFSWNKSANNKRIYRDEDDKVLGGVCSGIGYYFGVDRIWIRAAFLIMFFVWGFGVIPYIILWIIIPKAKTTAEKLEMKGEAVNLDNIKKNVEDRFNDMKDTFNGEKGKDFAKKAESVASKVANFLVSILVFAFKIFVKFIGVILIITGVALLISLLATVFNSDIVTITNSEEIFTIQSFDLFNAVVGEGIPSTLTIFTIILLIGIPVIFLLYSGIKILFNLKTNNKAIGIGMASLWIVGVIMAIFIFSKTTREFRKKQKVSSEIVWNSPSNTVYLSDIQSDDEWSNSIFVPSFESKLWLEDGKIYAHDLEVDVLPTSGNKIRIKIEKEARGLNRKNAGERAEQIEFNYLLQDSTLKFSPYIFFDTQQKYRHQEVKVHIYLPIGSKIALQDGSENIIYDIKNKNNDYDWDMVGETWIMLSNGLNCLDCEYIDGVKSDELENDTTSKW